MRRCIAIAILLPLAACGGRASPIALPGGGTGYKVVCSGVQNSIYDCYEKAAQLCPAGYDVITGGAEMGTNSVLAAMGGYNVGAIDRALLIGCRQMAPAFTAPQSANAIPTNFGQPPQMPSKAPIVLDVGQLEIVSEYQAPARPPNYEHLMPVSPQTAAIRWAKDRLKPMGRSGFARVVIRDASVIRTDIDSGIGTTERYDGRLGLQVLILDAHHLPVADVVTAASRFVILPGGSTPSERERVLTQLAQLLMSDSDSRLDELIHAYEARWVMQSNTVSASPLPGRASTCASPPVPGMEKSWHAVCD